MRSKLAPYWGWKHQDARDFQVFGEMQPAAMLILDPDRSMTQRAYDVCRDTLFILRDYPRSLATPDGADPAQVGRATAEFWADRVNAIAPFIPIGQVLVLDENEPDVYSAAGIARHNAREAAFVDRCTALGLRAGAGRYAVGWPHNVANQMRSNWPAHKPVIDAIRRGHGKNVKHVMIGHEYGGSASFGANPAWWGWKLGRFQHLAEMCPDIPIIIGEFGFDAYADDPQKNRPEVRGWQANTNWEAYWAGAQWYDAQLQYWPQVIAACMYLYDFAEREWSSFNWRDKREVVLNYMRNLREGRVALLPQMAQPTYVADNYAALLKGSAPTPTPTPTATSDPVWDAIKAALGARATDLTGKLMTNGSYPQREVKTVQRIIVHHSTGQPTVTWEGIAKYHVEHNKWEGIGYHFGIRQDGTVQRLNPTNRISNHASGANADSIGFCFAGDGRTLEPSQASRDAFARARAAAEGALGRPLTVMGHRDVGLTVCPGDKIYNAIVKADPLRAALLAEAGGHDLTLANPDAALCKAIVGGGLVVGGPEFEIVVDGKKYVAQVGRKPGSDKAQVFYCPVGAWDKVASVS